MSDSPIAILTGGGSGIGRATAMQLAAAGWRVAIVGRRGAKLEETRTMIAQQRANAKVLPITLDIEQPEAAAMIIRTASNTWGHRIDAIINNSALLLPGPISRATDDAALQSFAVNVFAPLRLMREAWPIMAQHGGGRIINVSSLASVDPFPGLGVYGMTKSALEGLTRAINKEGRPQRVLAFNILLGAVETDMLRSVVSENQVPRGQAMDPHAVARVIVACAGGQRDRDAGKPIMVR